MSLAAMLGLSPGMKFALGLSAQGIMVWDLKIIFLQKFFKLILGALKKDFGQSN